MSDVPFFLKQLREKKKMKVNLSRCLRYCMPSSFLDGLYRIPLFPL